MGSKRNSAKRWDIKTGALVLACVAIIGGSFMFASGEMLIGPDSLVASVVSIFYGRPIVSVSRDPASPTGSIPPGTQHTLAMFDLRSSNVTHGANVQNIKLRMVISGTGASLLNVTNVSMSYRYCVPPGITYGYGYPGGQCATIYLAAPQVTRNGNTYTVSFGQFIPVYPEQSSGVLTISGTPIYSVRTRNGRDSGRIDISLSATASGDQCRTIRYGYQNRYGYVKCSPAAGTVIGYSSSGVNITRPYGYGYGYVRTTSTVLR